MRFRFLMIALACVQGGLAQFTEFRSVIDPPGDNAYATLVDGLVAPAGEVYVLGGYQNIQEPAFTLARYEASGEFVWGRKVEATSAGSQLEPRKVVRVSSGVLFVFGRYATNSAQNYFITRMAPDGSVQWTRSYRQEITGFDYGFSSIVATSDDQLVVSMGLINRTVAMRLDLDGNVLWARNYITDLSPTDKNPGFDFAATADGGVLLTEKAEDDIFLVRLASDGEVLWAKRYPNGGYCHTHTAILLIDGGFLIAGSRDTRPFAARVDADGHMIWLKEYAFDEGMVDLLDQAVELSDEDYLLTPSHNSAGIMSLRLSPLGAPQGVRTIGGGGYMTLAGAHDGGVVLMGRALVELDGGFEDAMLLTAVDETLNLGCLQGSTGATATDIPIPAPVLGCTVLDEPIITDTVLTFVSSALFGTRSLCSAFSGVPDLANTGVLNVHPSPVHAGGTVQIGFDASSHPTRWEILSAQGQLIASMQVPAEQERAVISTLGWAPGLYLVRLAQPGSAWLTARLVVE